MSKCFSVTFLGAFSTGVEILQGSAWVENGSARQGGFSLPEKRGLVSGVAAVSLLPSPAF